MKNIVNKLRPTQKLLLALGLSILISHCITYKGSIETFTQSKDYATSITQNVEPPHPAFNMWGALTYAP